MSLVDELQRLEELHRRGSLTDAEYQQAKAALLANGATSPPNADHLAELRYQNELARIDREWEIEREQYLIPTRYGRRIIPTTGMGILTGVVGGGFGIFWTIMAVTITSDAPDFGAFSIAKVMFPVVGVVVIFGAIAWGVYCYHRAVQYQAAYQAYQDRRRAQVTRP